MSNCSWCSISIVCASRRARIVNVYRIVRDAVSARTINSVDVINGNVTVSYASDFISSWTSIVGVPVVYIHIIDNHGIVDVPGISV